MQQIDIQTLIANRLEDLADQVYYLHTQGMPEEAELLRKEGLMLAEAFDGGKDFLYVGGYAQA